MQRRTADEGERGARVALRHGRVTSSYVTAASRHVTSRPRAPLQLQSAGAAALHNQHPALNKTTTYRILYGRGTFKKGL